MWWENERLTNWRNFENFKLQDTNILNGLLIRQIFISPSYLSLTALPVWETIIKVLTYYVVLNRIKKISETICTYLRHFSQQGWNRLVKKMNCIKKPENPIWLLQTKKWNLNWFHPCMNQIWKSHRYSLDNLSIK